MIMDAKGVDLGDMSEVQRSSFFNMINLEPSACDEPYSLAKSLRDNASCRDSLIVAQFLADRLASGATPSAIADELDAVRDSLRERQIDISDSPVYGDVRAPVTVVMFADFQCPHCKTEAPQVRNAIDQFRGRVKLVFKHFPLKTHPRAAEAAVATEAAREQGKFWEMHDLVFAHQNQLEDEDLSTYAEQIGLDVARFKNDMQAERVRARVDRDRAEGEKLEIQGTPAVFVQGRYYNDLLFGGTVEGWIDEMLKR
jgi:protein-disulfide isomerase